jgi:hypothetical protein
MNYKVTLRKIELVTHNVLRLVTDKPEGYTFTPGQATEMAIDEKGLKSKKRPFTFTSLLTPIITAKRLPIRVGSVYWIIRVSLKRFGNFFPCPFFLIKKNEKIKAYKKKATCFF